MAVLGVIGAIIGVLVFLAIGVVALVITLGIKIAKVLLLSFVITVMLVSAIMAIKVWGPKIKNHFRR